MNRLPYKTLAFYNNPSRGHADSMAMNFAYDNRKQLLSVAAMKGNVAEQYVYDPAGNILSKTIDGKTTTYTYDKANQLGTAVMDEKTTNYAYDAAGRLV